MAVRGVIPKEEFNKNRKILLLNIPPSTEGEIREFLGVFRAKKIVINESLDSAFVTLINGNQVDEAVEKLNNKQFKDNVVAIRPGFSNQLVCIAHIPLTYTDNSFRDFCRKYGPVEYSYVIRAAGSGLSKGYGLVEFTADLERVKQIKSEIDWHSLDGHTLHADFVGESYQTWEGLQSRCLLINNMPEDFVDVSKLRETFSCVTSPVYCQIIAKGDKSVGFGIIEFRTPDDAEKTWVKLKNEKISGKDVIMTFCIPGKSAVVINNRIMWKYGDKLQKSNSLLPDPVSAKPVIAGNPIVISLTKHNPKLMGDFTSVLGELQQAYVSQMMSPENKPGLLGPAPSLPLSPMMNPNMQLGLLVMLALHIQGSKKEQFTGVLAKQLNTLSEQDGSEQKSGPKPSILGDPLTGQANVILTSLKQQLNQVPVTGENGKPLEEPKSQDEKIRFLVKKFVANGRYLNLGLLSNLGQLLVNMKHGDMGSHDSGGKGQSLLGPMPAGTSHPLMTTPLVKGASLLGDAPGAAVQPSQSATTANASINSSIMQAMGLNVGSGSSMGNMGQTLLSQISQGLVHQIGQNILYQMTVNQTGSGKGLLGDVPADSSQKSKSSSAGNKPLLGDAPLKSNQGAVASTTPDQGTWKSMENRKRMEMAYDNKSQMDRWGSGAYESPYGSKGVMGTSGNEYGYDAYGNMSGDMSGGAGNYGGYGEGASEYYNYQSQYGYGGQADNVYQTESGYNSQFASAYGMTAGMNSGTGFGMNTGFEGNQSSAANFQEGQVYGKEGSSGIGQDSAKYGNDGYGSNMSGAGYGYGGRTDGYESYDMSGSYSTGMGDRMGSGGIGDSDVASRQMGGGGMSNAFTGGSGSMAKGRGMDGSGQIGSGGMDSSAQMGSGGMGGGGQMGSGSMGNSGQMGSGGMGQMGSGGMGNSGQMGSGGMGQMGSVGMGNSGQMGSGGMGNSGQMGSGGMGNSGQMGSGGMGNSGQMGSGGMGNSGQMGSGVPDRNNVMGSRGMDGTMMNSGGSGYMGSGGVDGSNYMGSGGMDGSGYMGSGGMDGSGYMGSGGMSGSGYMGSGDMGGGGYMGSGGMDGSGYMGSGGMSGSGYGGSGSGYMGSGDMGGSGYMGSGGMDGSGYMGSGNMDRSGQMGSGSGQTGSGGLGSGLMGNGGSGNGLLENNSGGHLGGNFGSMSGGLRSGGTIGEGLLGRGGKNVSDGLSGNRGGGLLGTGSGGMNTMTDSYNTSAGMGNTNRSSMGGGGGGNMSSGTGSSMGGAMAGMSSRANTAYFTGGESSSSSAALLPSPSKYMTMAGQKRGLNQLLPQPDNAPESSDYMGQRSQAQGSGGRYGDAYKRNRLY